MKKWLAFGLLLGIFTSCDDGDLVYEDLTFSDSQVAQCADNSASILYKLNGDQVFIINLPNLATDLPTEPTNVGEPKRITIGGNNRVLYRHYNGTATRANICDVIQPATPIIDNEWTALSGQILIETVAISTPNTTAGFSGGDRISKLQHSIKFENIVFRTSNGEQSYDTFNFGIFTQDYVMPAIPSPNELLEICNGKIFNRNSTSIFSVELSATLLDPTVLGVKTEYIDNNLNKVEFRQYAAGSNRDQVDITLTNGCTNLFTPPESIWIGENGNGETLSGIIEVTTTNQVSGFVSHSIVLKNVRMKKGNLSFDLADSYILGEIIRPN